MIYVSSLRCDDKKSDEFIDSKNPMFSFIIKSECSDVFLSAYNILVSDDYNFSNIFWDSDFVSCSSSQNICYLGKELSPHKIYYYKIRVKTNKGTSGFSQTACFKTAFFDVAKLNAKFICCEKNEGHSSKSYYVNNFFSVNKKVKRAVLYSSALGIYEPYINGEKIGFYFMPGFTSYKNRLFYQAFEITEFIKDGENAIGAEIGTGWYKGDLAPFASDNLTEEEKQKYKYTPMVLRRNHYGDSIAFWAFLLVTYEDGEEVYITTDESWKCQESPTTYSEFYHGVVYDSLKKFDWCKEPLEKSVYTTSYPLGNLALQQCEYVKALKTVKPAKLFVSPKGEKIIDFGQNLVGVLKFLAKGKKGEVLKIKHAEILDKNGNFYIDNLRSARQEIVYICNGENEYFSPSFTYMGFRYIMLEGFCNEVSLKDFEALVLATDLEKTSDFSCSEPLIQRLYENVERGMLGNFVDIPTDCPQRDERLGWTADTHIFAPTACLLRNCKKFYEKWLVDLALDQYENGAVPHVIPHVLLEKHVASSGWADASVVLPYVLYKHFGDKNVLRNQYESMKKWVYYIKNEAKGDLWLNEEHFHFGDWLALDMESGECIGATDVLFIANAYYYYCIDIMVKTSKILEQNEDFEEFKTLKEKVFKAFNEKYVKKDGSLKIETQTAYVLAISFGLLDGSNVKYLADNIKSKGHMTTGFLGVKDLLKVLSENGEEELALNLLLRKEYPSWLYSVVNDATTIWEHWDGVKPDGEFWSADMNSYNHYAYGAVFEWVFSNILGIKQKEESIGFQEIVIKPIFSDKIKHAKGYLKTINGKLKVSYTIEKTTILEITVPCNTKCTVVLTNGFKETVGSGNYVYSFVEEVDCE